LLAVLMMENIPWRRGRGISPRYGDSERATDGS
jgi:hypothetical protein